MVNYQEVGEHILAENPGQLGSIAKRIIRDASDHTIWLFKGEMGAGKTTLIQAICMAKGVMDQVTSPTYTLVHEYLDLHGATYYHFDFYRLNHLGEVQDIGCEEYLYSGNICFIEWPDLIEPLLPEKFITIELQVTEDDSRLIKITRND
jgi:tRNA threonylcarbamoyladenosine biosynthesis protein TsaE